jgi:DNA-binding transcriptional LysR family regulator
MYHKWLRSFNAVAKEGLFAAAGRSLNIGQSTVTTQVKALNERFKVELFHRKGH